MGPSAGKGYGPLLCDNISSLLLGEQDSGSSFPLKQFKQLPIRDMIFHLFFLLALCSENFPMTYTLLYLTGCVSVLETRMKKSILTSDHCQSPLEKHQPDHGHELACISYGHCSCDP